MVKKSKVVAEPTAAAAAPAPTWEEMEHKREAMTNSLKALGAAMALCTSLIADYTAVSSSIPLDAPSAAIQANGSGEKRKLPKKEKSPRDPNKPKRPASAYLLFQTEFRKQMAETNPGMPNTVLMAALGEKWGLMTDEEKKPYQDKYDIAQAQWRTQTDAYNETLPDSERPKSRAPKKKTADVPAPAAAAATEASSSDEETETDDESVAAKQVAQPAAEDDSETSDSETSESEDTESEDTVSSMPPHKKAKTTAAKSVPAPSKPAPPPPQPATPVAKTVSKEKKKDAAAATPASAPAAVAKPKKKKADKA